MKTIIAVTAIYYVFVNLLSALLAYSDKRKAVKGKWRIPENTLLLIGLIGGAAGEYVMMKKIHHKTQHAKFMIGLPLEFTLHIIIIALIIAKVAN
ncbi:MAG: DUF1294 domain-containing protein [Eubacterium sp.]|nr:DUF1294 domain-containing protein [Eubacterium sp.]MDE6156254.1 DUF1294 domain-containing protein [Eubacterium sp.]